MITVYTLAYNEELLVKFMIDHYRERFPGCKIVIYDNMSTDNTVNIALTAGCEIIPYNTNNELQDMRYLEIKNNCWKNAKTDWVVVCDMDELLDITLEQLQREEAQGSTIITSDTYDMINMENTDDIAGITYGIKSPITSKTCLFNKKYIREINYDIGCHACHPVGEIKYSTRAYKLYHYASLGEDVTIARFKERAPRLSAENLANKWGFHYLMTPQEIKNEYIIERKKAVKIRD